MSVESESLINSESNEKLADIPSKLKGEKSLKEFESEEIVIDASLKDLITNGIEAEEDGEGDWEDLLGSGSLMKKILVQGKPDSRPQRLEKCVISFECTLEDDTLIEKCDNFEMLLGDCEVCFC